MTWSSFLQVEPNSALVQGRLVSVSEEFSLASGATHALYVQTGSRPVAIHSYTVATKSADRDLTLRRLRGPTVTGGTPVEQAPLNDHVPATLPFAAVLSGVTVTDPGQAGPTYLLVGEARGAPALLTAISVLAPNEEYVIEITNASAGNADVIALLTASQMPPPLPF